MRVPAVCAKAKQLKAVAARHGPAIAPPAKGCESRRHLIRFKPPIYGLWHCFTHSSCICNDIVACVNRVIGSVPLPTRTGVQQLRREILTFQRGAGTFAPLTLEESLATFKGARHKIYERAYNSLLIEPFNDKDGRIKAFVKAERFDPLEKVEPDPRMIQARDPRYNLMLSTRLRNVEHYVYGLINNGLPMVAKCLNPSQRFDLLREKWIRFVDPVCVSLDSSRWDMHISSEILSVEHEFYNSCYPGDPLLQRMLKMQTKNVCTTSNGLRYVVNGGRMSGDMNTGLGNILLACGMAISGMRQLGIKHYQLLDDGDDILAIVERSSLDKLVANLPRIFLEFGQELKIENVTSDIRQVVFCQSKPTWNGERYIFARNWRKILSQSCCGTKHWNDPHMVRAMFGLLGDCELAQHAGIPIIQSFAQQLQLLSLGKRARVSCLDSSYQYRIGSWGLNLSSVKPKVITTRARVEFAEVWGVEISEQVEIERQLSQWQPSIFARTVPGELSYGDWAQYLDPAIQNPSVL